MEQFDKAYFQRLAAGIMLDVNDDEVEDLKGEFDVLTQQIQLFDKVDTEGVEPMVYPFEEETSFLREDEVTHVLTQEEALAGGPKTEAGMFVAPRILGSEE